MRLDQERRSIVEYGKRLITSQLTTGTGGNLSIYNRAEGLVAIKPNGVPYLEMNEDDIVVVDLDGQVVEGKHKPSSEVNIHIGLYKLRADIQAVVHTHQVYATTIACLNWELPAVHYVIGLAGDKVPLAPYATYGSKELSENVINSIGDYNACLMANHGLVTVGRDLASAFAIAEQIEFVSRLYYQAKCIGDPVILSDEQMLIVTKKFKIHDSV